MDLEFLTSLSQIKGRHTNFISLAIPVNGN